MVSHGKRKDNLEMVQFEIPELDSSSLPLVNHPDNQADIINILLAKFSCGTSAFVCSPVVS